jgi:hypothetical protein
MQAEGNFAILQAQFCEVPNSLTTRSYTDPGGQFFRAGSIIFAKGGVYVYPLCIIEENLPDPEQTGVIPCEVCLERAATFLTLPAVRVFTCVECRPGSRREYVWDGPLVRMVLALVGRGERLDTYMRRVLRRERSGGMVAG